MTIRLTILSLLTKEKSNRLINYSITIASNFYLNILIVLSSNV